MEFKEFKEFENPEQANYDVIVGAKNVVSSSSKYDNSLNSEDGIDLNAFDDFDDCAMTDEDRKKKIEDLKKEKEYYESCIKQPSNLEQLVDDYSDCAKVPEIPVPNESDSNFTINEFGEIIRAEKGKSR